MSNQASNAHTPGPWAVSRGAQADPFSIEAGSHTVAHVKFAVFLGTTEANARLIAAAPELLEALKVFYNWNKPCTCKHDSCGVCEAERAIAAAEGRDAD